MKPPKPIHPRHKKLPLHRFAILLVIFIPIMIGFAVYNKEQVEPQTDKEVIFSCYYNETKEQCLERMENKHPEVEGMHIVEGDVDYKKYIPCRVLDQDIEECYGEFLEFYPELFNKTLEELGCHEYETEDECFDRIEKENQTFPSHS